MKDQEKQDQKTRRIAVVNFSGNVGKTTIAAQLLASRMPDAPFYSIESTNVDASADGFKVVRLRGKDYGDLLVNIFLADEVIVDVGASNISDFMKLMQQYQTSHEVFDCYLIPVVKEKKQQADTINTIDALAALGVPPEKIKVVFNKVEADDPLDTVFAPIFGAQTVKKSFTVSRSAVVYQNDAFEKTKNRNKSLTDIVIDPTDYRARAREAKTPAEREQAVSMAMIKMLSVSAVRNLDHVYKSLF
jgi:cellulose biosynthesis protein BcsQ